MVNRINSGYRLYYAKTSIDIDPLNSGLLAQSIKHLMVGSLSTSVNGRLAIRHIDPCAFETDPSTVLL
jgi:hypothetical protein